MLCWIRSIIKLGLFKLHTHTAFNGRDESSRAWGLNYLDYHAFMGARTYVRKGKNKIWWYTYVIKAQQKENIIRPEKVQRWTFKKTNTK